MTQTFDITWYGCRADHADVAFNKQQRKDKATTRVVKVGDELWRVPYYIGPIGVDHNHWAGTHLTLNEAQGEYVKSALLAYQAAGHEWPAS